MLILKYIGPLTFYNKTTEKTTIVGVVSWGYGCASKNNYGVYARLSQVLPWIKENSDLYTQTCNYL